LRDGLALLGDGVRGQSRHRRPKVLPNLWFAMRRWIDELTFHTRVVVTVLVVAIVIAALAWDVMKTSF
jgi:hypothetical protein